MTRGLETDACIPCAAPKRELGALSAKKCKYGARSCPVYPNKP
jgi:hypothetical protein